MVHGKQRRTNRLGYVIGIKLNDTLGGVAGLVIAGGIGWYIQKNHSKKDD